MSQRAPESLSEQPMFFDGETKKTFPVPTSAGTNVVVVSGALDGDADPGAGDDAGLEPLDFDGESDPPHAPTSSTRKTTTTPSHRRITRP